jgi:site-specific DNA-methyltransferase (adenine-specific)
MNFEVVYVDPPWSFRNTNTGGSLKSGAAQKYPVMDLGAITRLAVPALAAPSSVLALWVPSSLKFSHGLEVIRAWDFEYITTVYWEKTGRLGMGFWFRNQVEELLICKRRRGYVEPFRCRVPNIIHAPAEEHSAKPEAFRQLLEKATGKISRRRNVELFARRAVPGWTCLGQQVTGRDIRDDLKRLALAA